MKKKKSSPAADAWKPSEAHLEGRADETRRAHSQLCQITSSAPAGPMLSVTENHCRHPELSSHVSQLIFVTHRTLCELLGQLAVSAG